MVSFRRLATLLVAALLPLGHASPLPETRAASVVEGKYIITLKDEISAAALGGHMNWVRDVHENSLGRRQLSFAGVEKTFGVGNFNAYAGHFDADTLERIRNSPEVSLTVKLGRLGDTRDGFESPLREKCHPVR